MGVKKIVVIGSESTGKSTLSAGLADALDTVWVEEYARDYLLQLGRPYEESDLLKIAKGQLAIEDEKLKQANEYLICDTDLNVIKVWAEASYGRCDNWILEQIKKRKYHAYILTDIDMPWVDDPLREHPLPHERQYFFDLYKAIVEQSGVPFVIASGDEQERLQKALSFITTH